MRKITSLIAAAFMMVTPAVAGDNPVVVELFTSQGCSSCPPADEFLHTLAKRDDVIALALHVDYWDYIGWKDEFADPAHTTRQRGYARSGGHRLIYTPQMVINGLDHVIGARPMDVTDLIDAHRKAQDKVALQLTREAGVLTISAEAKGPVGGPLIVQVVRYRPNSVVDIKRGENAGRTLSYANVVTEMSSVTQWDISAPLNIEVPVDGDLPAAVLVQHYEYGPIEAAAVAR